MPSITEDLGSRSQTSCGPVSDRGIVKGLQRFNGGVPRMLQRFVGFHRHHERLLVLRATSGFATVELSTQIRVVGLNEHVELGIIASITLCFMRHAVR